MSDEKTSDWSLKRILMVVVGAVVLGGTAALQESAEQSVKNLFASEQKSHPIEKSEALPAPKPLPVAQPAITIGNGNIGTAVGDHNTLTQQGVQSGSNNTQTNYFGVTNIELAKQLGVKESAIENFLKLLEHQNVPPNELDSKLRAIAERHKELEKRVAQLESKDPAVTALQQKAREAIKSFQYEQAEELLNQAVELDINAAKKINDAYLERMRSAAENMTLKAETLFTRFAFSKAIAAYEEAIQYAKEGKIEEKTAEYQNMLGRVYFEIAQYRKAIEYFELALASDLKNFGEDHPNVAIRRNNLGLAWDSLGQYQKAIGYYELALASDLKTYGEDHPNVAVRRSNLGTAWYSLGQYQKAIEYFELALANGLKIYGEDYPDVAIRRSNLGSAWDSLGEHQKAIGYYEMALASDLKTYGEDHPQVATYRNNLGKAWDLLGQHQKAIEYYELALASDLKTYGEDHPQVAIYRNNLGFTWYSQGQYQKAIGYYELALASNLKTYGEDHPHVAICRNNLGKAWYFLDEYQKAIGYYELALPVLNEKLGVEHPHSVAGNKNLEAAKAALVAKN